MEKESKSTIKWRVKTREYDVYLIQFHYIPTEGINQNYYENMATNCLKIHAIFPTAATKHEKKPRVQVSPIAAWLDFATGSAAVVSDRWPRHRLQSLQTDCFVCRVCSSTTAVTASLHTRLQHIETSRHFSGWVDWTGRQCNALYCSPAAVK